jgi:hypothetical protein
MDLELTLFMEQKKQRRRGYQVLVDPVLIGAVTAVEAHLGIIHQTHNLKFLEYQT